jgi:hypothetical protein
MLEKMTIHLNGSTSNYQPLLADISEYWDFLDRTKTSNNAALGQLFIAYLATVGENPKTKAELLKWSRDNQVHVDLGEEPDPTQTAASLA